MAIVEARTPLALEAGEPDVKPFGVFARPTGAQTGWKSWLTSVDHKKIGIMYGIGSMFFFFIGGGEALPIRLQLARLNQKLLSPSQTRSHHARRPWCSSSYAHGGGFSQLPLPLRRGPTSRSPANAFSLVISLLFNSS